MHVMSDQWAKSKLKLPYKFLLDATIQMFVFKALQLVVKFVHDTMYLVYY